MHWPTRVRCTSWSHQPWAMPLLEKAGVAADLDEGCIALNGAASPAAFVEQCRQLRHWPREQAVDQTRAEPDRPARRRT